MLNLYENDTIDGWMSLLELVILNRLAEEMQSVVELGCYKGRSTYALMQGCKDVTAIDDFSMLSPDQVDPRVKVKIINAKSDTNMRETDMLFIDASHEYEDVKKDILAWRPFVKKLICGHDYDYPDVKRAVNEVIGTPDEVVGSTWLKWISS